MMTLSFWLYFAGGQAVYALAQYCLAEPFTWRRYVQWLVAWPVIIHGTPAGNWFELRRLRKERDALDADVLIPDMLEDDALLLAFARLEREVNERSLQALRDAGVFKRSYLQRARDEGILPNPENCIHEWIWVYGEAEEWCIRCKQGASEILCAHSDWMFSFGSEYKTCCDCGTVETVNGRKPIFG